MFIQSLYRHKIFGCQDDTENIQIQNSTQKPNPVNIPIVQKMERNDKTNQTKIDPYLEYLLLWKHNSI